MSRSPSYLRRGLLGLVFVGSLGFGATQALASPEQARFTSCPATGYDYAYQHCAAGCPGGRGYCDAYGRCQCGHIP